MNNDSKISVISIHPKSVSAHTSFNQNGWEGKSKFIISSCAAEYSMLNYTMEKLRITCNDPKSRCQPYFERLLTMWSQRQWDLNKCSYFGEDPELHALIEGFFSGLKSLLDIIVRLLSTEGVVTSQLNGFHERGGRVLSALARNAPVAMNQHVEKFIELIKSEKTAWIDEIIRLRDSLIHPNYGAGMLMFRLDIELIQGSLTYKGADPPMIKSLPAPDICEVYFRKMTDFCKAFLALFPRESTS